MTVDEVKRVCHENKFGNSSNFFVKIEYVFYLKVDMDNKIIIFDGADYCQRLAPYSLMLLMSTYEVTHFQN